MNNKHSTPWVNVQLQDVIKQFIVPMRDKPKSLEGDIPWCRIEDIEGKYIQRSKKNQGVSLQTIDEMNLKIIPQDSLILSCSATIGVAAITKNRLITNQTFIGMIPGNNISIEFLYYLLSMYRNKFKTLGSGTTIPYISRKTFEKFRVILPEKKSEQQKIAAILSSVDEAIEKTEQLIAQTEKVKKGLMQQLLTKGIGHSDFKKSEVGTIPEEWDVIKIEDVFNTIDGDRGKNYPGENDFRSNGYCLFLDTKNVTKNGFSFDTKKFISKEKDTSLRSGKLHRNDIVMTSRGTIGNISFYDESIPYENVRINSAMLILRAKKQNLNYQYWIQLLNGKVIKEYIQKFKVGSAQPHITKKSFNELKVAVPKSIEEQEKISDILTSIGEKIIKEENKHAYLLKLKKGLMQQLLTGKVRVPVDEDEVVEA